MAPCRCRYQRPFAQALAAGTIDTAIEKADQFIRDRVLELGQHETLWDSWPMSVDIVHGPSDAIRSEVVHEDTCQRTPARLG